MQGADVETDRRQPIPAERQSAQVHEAGKGGDVNVRDAVPREV